MPLDNVKESLEENQNIDSDVKKKIYNLVELFVKKIPNIDLTKLCNNLRTFKFGKISKYEKCGVYRYDCVNNEILFSKKLEEDYDIDHLLMKAILEMSTNNGKFTGFNSNELLYALNLAYTEILANYIVGNEGDSDLEEEVLLTNLISLVVGKDEMLNAYFSNNGDIIIKAMQDAEVGV